MDNRNVFRNPALIGEMKSNLFFESDMEFGYMGNDLGIVLGRDLAGASSGEVFAMVSDNLGANLGVRASKGEGIEALRGRLGYAYDDMEFFGGLTWVDVEDGDVSLDAGLVFPIMNEMLKLFATADVTFMDGNDPYSFLVGAGSVYSMTSGVVFGDFRYIRTRAMETTDDMVATLGAKVMLPQYNTTMMLSGERHLYFEDATYVNAGVSWMPIVDFKVDLAARVDAVQLADPGHADYDWNLSLTYYL